MASHPGIVLRLLSWNLFHGRDCPPNPALSTWRSRLLRSDERDATHVQVNRPLRTEFAARLAGWDWDVALLQEAPPRWLPELARASHAGGVRDLTSRNSFPTLRARLADWSPDLMRSAEGGSNMLLARRPARIVATAAATLATTPERRRMLMARLELSGGRRIVVCCLHLSVPSTGQGADEAMRAAEIASAWAAGDPLVVGGDFNLRPVHHGRAFDELRERFGLERPTGPRAIDHLLAAEALDTVAAPVALAAVEREVAGPGGLAIRLSDHAPVVGAFGLR
ncbi:MAG TPA: endonuclease/exonuclease/phosphatase family protein [Thermoleophilaceae bacterium]|nr:endonuclease/exonuclease/phosphatase family protein [Thermoleophilaceae bacterium]